MVSNGKVPTTHEEKGVDEEPDECEGRGEDDRHGADVDHREREHERRDDQDTRHGQTVGRSEACGRAKTADEGDGTAARSAVDRDRDVHHA